MLIASDSPNGMACLGSLGVSCCILIKCNAYAYPGPMTPWVRVCQTGENALIKAAMWGHLDAVQTLLSLGLDPNYVKEVRLKIRLQLPHVLQLQCCCVARTMSHSK